MNYEQKYHEALERAKKMRDSIIGSHNPESAKLHVGHIENIFPELAESEDERIRMILIESFERANCSEIDKLVNCRLNPADILAWLEKQKEQKSLPPVSSGARYYFDEWIKQQPILKYWDAFLAGIDFNKKEQKVDIDKLRKDIYQSGYNDGYQHGREDEQKEQKPVQFKNNKLVDIIKGEFEGFRTLLKKKGIDYEPQRIYWEGFARLFDSSAREYVREQKPAEWSEEDEKIRKTLLDYYEKALDNYTCVEWLNGITYGELFDWLKSLRPSWKPSEEQMEALKDAVKLYKETHFERFHQRIESLYEQLKAL